MRITFSPRAILDGIRALFLVALIVVPTGALAAPTLYATGNGISNGGLYSVDPSTGAATFIGDAGGGAMWHSGGLAYDSANGTFFATGYNANTSGQASLYTVNPSTGAGTLVATYDPLYQFGLGGLAYDSKNNVLYASGFKSGSAYFSLFMIDPVSYSLSDVGSFGYEATRGYRYIYGLGYDPVTGTLYGNGLDLFDTAPPRPDGYSQLFTIDTTTGIATDIATEIGYHGITASRQLTYSGLAVDPVTGKLLSLGSVTGAMGGLYEIDPSTGVAKLIGSSVLPGLGVDGGLAFGPSDAASVPEPSTMLLLGSGLAGLVGYGRRKFKK